MCFEVLSHPVKSVAARQERPCGAASRGGRGPGCRTEGEAPPSSQLRLGPCLRFHPHFWPPGRAAEPAWASSRTGFPACSVDCGLRAHCLRFDPLRAWGALLVPPSGTKQGSDVACSDKMWLQEVTGRTLSAQEQRGRDSVRLGVDRTGLQGSGAQALTSRCTPRL